LRWMCMANHHDGMHKASIIQLMTYRPLPCRPLPCH
jgi:hypothetical protein